MNTIVSIPGIHCEGCAKLIKDVSTEFPTITKVDVDVASKQVTIEHNDQFDLPKWSEEIESLDPKYKIHPISSSSL
jgi:copper chaperone CopZ